VEESCDLRVAGIWSAPAFNIVVRLKHDADRFEVEMPRAWDDKVLMLAWCHIRGAYQTCQEAATRGVYLDKIRVLSGGLQELFVIGYVDNRPPRCDSSTGMDRGQMTVTEVE
jgi:hypothetical protein